MSDLAALLAGLDDTSRLKAARARAPRASVDELIRALRVLQPVGPAERFLIGELARRGPVDVIANALAEGPLSPAAESFGEALFQLYERAPEARAPVAAALIHAAGAILDAGGGSAGATWPIELLAFCSRLAGPLPEAAPVAQRLLAVAAAEERPCPAAVGPAEHLAGMRTLAAQLAGLDPDEAERAAREHAPSTSLEELVRAVQIIEPMGRAGRYLARELARRGADAAFAMAQALVADPLSNAAETFCAALAGLHERAPELRARVVAALIDGVSAVLEAGGGSREASTAIVWLQRCARRGGPVPEAVSVALRLCAVAASEEDPYLPAVGAAERLAGLPVADLGEILVSTDADARWSMAWKYAPSASLEEVIEAVGRHPPNDGAQDFLATELADRGADAAPAVARALLASPLSAAVPILGESLVRISRDEREARDLVVTTLIEAITAGLDAGGGTRGAAAGMQHLRDCASIAGPLPEAAPVARRLLAVAAAEVEPDMLAVHAAQHLLGAA